MTEKNIAQSWVLKNNYKFAGNEESDLKIQKWRIEFEEKKELEREFFRVAIIEDLEKKSEEIKNIMKSEYGKNIENWLKNNFNES